MCNEVWECYTVSTSSGAIHILCTLNPENRGQWQQFTATVACAKFRKLSHISNNRCGALLELRRQTNSFHLATTLVGSSCIRLDSLSLKSGRGPDPQDRVDAYAASYSGWRNSDESSAVRQHTTEEKNVSCLAWTLRMWPAERRGGRGVPVGRCCSARQLESHPCTRCCSLTTHRHHSNDVQSGPQGRIQKVVQPCHHLSQMHTMKRVKATCWNKFRGQ